MRVDGEWAFSLIHKKYSIVYRYTIEGRYDWHDSEPFLRAEAVNARFDANITNGGGGEESSPQPPPPIFRMVLPPPNVTGNLHLGHALTVTVEDAICRHRQLMGQKVIIAYSIHE